MEGQNNDREFEQFLKENADNHRLYPSDEIWNKIHARLHAHKRWPLTALLLLAFTTGSITWLANSERTTAILISTTDVSANDERMLLLANSVKESVKSLGSPSGVNILYTGTPIIQQRLGELISQDRKNTQWISTIFVFLIAIN